MNPLNRREFLRNLGVSAASLPFLSALLVYDNVACAVGALAPASAVLGDATAATNVQRARAGLYAFIVPLFLVAEFELNYEVHKRRSANFLLGLFTFDQGHRRQRSALANGARKVDIYKAEKFSDHAPITVEYDLDF